MASHWKRQEADVTPHKQSRTRNTPAQAESLMDCLKKAASGICLHVYADKTEYICLDQNKTGDISTQKGCSLKLVDKFTNRGRSVSYKENDINTRLAKTWSAIRRLSVIYR